MRKVINKQCYCFQFIFILFDRQIEEMALSNCMGVNSKAPSENNRSRVDWKAFPSFKLPCIEMVIEVRHIASDC